MKISNSLPSNLRFLFGCLRGLLVISAVVYVFGSLMLPWLSSHDAKRKPQSSMQVLAEVTLDFEPGVYRVQATGAASGDVALSWVRGTLRVNSASSDAELAALGRWRFFLSLTAPAFFYVCLDLLWRLCRNVERGEVFSESNTRHVRNLGLVILIYQAVACAAGYWYARMVDGFLLQRVVAEGVKLKLHWGSKVFPMDTTLIVTGLLLLTLSEVFRQGLALKKENELTV
jgi:hypothetical protein